MMPRTLHDVNRSRAPAAAELEAGGVRRRVTHQPTRWGGGEAL